MRRAGVVGSVIAAVAWAAAAGSPSAHAGPIDLTIEGGAEVDSNVRRDETRPRGERRVSAQVSRLGAKLARRGKLAGGAYSIAASGLSRVMLFDGNPANVDISAENVLLASGDVRWLKPIGERGVAVGFGLLGIDAIPLSDDIGSRTFRMVGGEGMLALRKSDGGENERSLIVTFGGRDFVYKPERDYDWRGPTASVRLELTLWQAAGGTRSIELSGAVGIEARSYDSVALATTCSKNAPPRDTCYAQTTMPRHDRVQRAGIELTWTGRIVAAAGYQLSVTDSNSYGLSLVRHRATLSATTNLPWSLYGTALATLQFDQYPDGLLVEQSVSSQSFTSLDDENRSSLQARIARPLSKCWAIEGRGAIWRNLGGTPDTPTFRRGLVYLGAVFTR